MYVVLNLAALDLGKYETDKNIPFASPRLLYYKLYKKSIETRPYPIAKARGLRAGSIIFGHRDGNLIFIFLHVVYLQNFVCPEIDLAIRNCLILCKTTI